jgi:hypothetical protein
MIQSALTHPVHFTHPFVAASASPTAGSQLGQCPLPSAQCWASFNWGGYAVAAPSGKLVTDVKGSWVVPQSSVLLLRLARTLRGPGTATRSGSELTGSRTNTSSRPEPVQIASMANHPTMPGTNSTLPALCPFLTQSTLVTS